MTPLLIGHRGSGAGSPLPENTLPSFDAALKQGCDGFEFDLRMRASGEVVICHNPEVDGIDVARAGPAQLPYAANLEQVLQRYARSAFLDIEVKVPGLESEVLIALAQDFPVSGFVVSSFSPQILTNFKIRSSRIPLGLICDQPDQLQCFHDLSIQYVMVHWSLLRREVIDNIHAAGLQCFAWTVNDRDSMLRFAQWGVDGIISDEIALMVRTFRDALARDRSRQHSMA